MKKESWLVKKDRFWAMRFHQEKFPDEDGTTYMRVHYASCEQGFLNGITPNVQLHESEKMSFKTARDLWKSSIETEWEASEKPLWKTS
mgnify:CR=1 FL=1|tara:strand:- start:243 stop:506 length:264 start_codon:yes stop_codon:yes gene_type:complete